MVEDELRALAAEAMGRHPVVQEAAERYTCSCDTGYIKLLITWFGLVGVTCAVTCSVTYSFVLLYLVCFQERFYVMMVVLAPRLRVRGTWYEEPMPVFSLLKLATPPGFQVNPKPEGEPCTWCISWYCILNYNRVNNLL